MKPFRETFNNDDGIDLKDLFNSQIENIRTLIESNDRNYNQRFENVIQATAQALAASDRAVSKAETASEKRFDAVNEFRATLADQQRNLMPRNEVDILIRSLNEKIDGAIQGITDARLGASQFLTVANYQSRHDELQKQVDDLKNNYMTIQGKGAGLNMGWLYLIGFIGLVSTILGIVSVVRHF